MNAFLTSVLSLVPAETPATSQPLPGSSSVVPNISMMVESVPSICTKALASSPLNTVINEVPPPYGFCTNESAADVINSAAFA